MDLSEVGSAAGSLLRERGLIEVGKRSERDEKVRDKPSKMREGILAGKMKKHLASISLLDQAFVRDEAHTVAESLGKLFEESGIRLSVEEHASLRIGE